MEAVNPQNPNPKQWQTEGPRQTQHAEFTTDISDENLWDIDPQKLRQQITLAPRMKRWCSHWHEDDLLTQAEALARSKADEHWNKHLADEALGYTGTIKTEPASHYKWQPDNSKCPRKTLNSSKEH
jgi:hypothetical protein